MPAAQGTASRQGSPSPHTSSTIGALTLAGDSWRALGTYVHLLVTDPRALIPARDLLRTQLAELDRAASRFRPDSEVQALCRAQGAPMTASSLLVHAVEVALEAARSTDGDVDPTLGSTLVALGYDRDFPALPAARPGRVGDLGAGFPSEITHAGERGRVVATRRASWRDVTVTPATVTPGTIQVPAGVLLDLGATAKALGADLAARAIHDALGCGVLVSLGGDLATAGRAPAGGWTVRVQDLPAPGHPAPGHPAPGRPGPDGPAQTVALTGGALATSSTTARRWQHGGEAMHHVLNPRTLRPVTAPWRTVSVAAPTCVAANTATTCAIVRGGGVWGDGAVAYLRGTGLPARLVAQDGSVTLLNGWPT
jgi:thiamine biosynthesis lipoprotein